LKPLQKRGAAVGVDFAARPLDEFGDFRIGRGAVIPPASMLRWMPKAVKIKIASGWQRDNRGLKTPG